MKYCLAVMLCAIALTSSFASAQLIVGTTSTTPGNPAVQYYDIGTGNRTTLWTVANNKGALSLAADPVGRKLYASPGARFLRWDFGSIGTAPPQIGAAMIRTGGITSPQVSNADDYTWANGGLYAGVNQGSTSYPRGIYNVPTTPDGNNQFVQTAVWTDPTAVPNGSGGFTLSGLYSMDGIAFNPNEGSSGMFYMTNRTTDVPTGLTPGIFRVNAFGDDSIVKVANFPVTSTHIDGMAYGGGKLWISEQVPAQSAINIYSYDLTTNTYDATVISIPFVDGTQRGVDIEYASADVLPEPTFLGAICVASLAALRRRRR